MDSIFFYFVIPEFFFEAIALKKNSGIHYYNLILLFTRKLIVKFNYSNGFPPPRE